MSLVFIHALPLKVVYLCGIVVIKGHSPYSTWQLLGEISRCGIRHRDIQLTSIVLHRTFQLSAAIEHALRIFASPRIGIEYCLQTRAIVKHPAHIRHLRDVEVGNVEFRQTRATREHLVHTRHRRGIEVGKVQRR